MNTEKYLKTGDVVKHSKNTYKRTVEKSNKEETSCVYFDESQNLHRVIYNTDELEFISH